MTRPPRSRRWFRLARGFAAGLLGGLVLVLAGPMLLRWQTFTVMSGSMQPAIGVGDVIVSRPVPAAQIEPGQVVTFRDPEGRGILITHRVRRVERHDDRIDVVTQGDANTAQERWSIPADGQVGRALYRLPHIGYVLHPLGSPAGRLLFIGLPITGWALLTLIDIWRRPTSGKSQREALGHAHA